MAFAIFIALFAMAVLLFLSFFILSKPVEADKNTGNLDIRGNWKAYLAAFIGTTLAIANLRLLWKGRAYIQSSDIYFYITSLFVVSPGARRLYRAMRDFIFRR